MRPHRVACLALVALALGCGPSAHPASTTTPAPIASTAASSTAGGSIAVKDAPPRDPFALPTDLSESDLSEPDLASLDVTKLVLPQLKVVGDGGYEIPAPPASCSAFVQRKASKAPACADAKSVLVALDEALARKDVAQRDAGLVAMEACAGVGAGVIRALRTELAPPECADALAEPALSNAKLSPVTRHLLFALALGARFHRGVVDPPKMPSSSPTDQDMEVLEKYFKGPLADWMKRTKEGLVAHQQAAIDAGLPSYARGIAEAEAAIAWFTFATKLRGAAPPPAARDASKEAQEIHAAYYAMLDKALAPFVDLAVDTAKRALINYAYVGAVSDDRLDSVRRAQRLHVVATGYLDGLALPALPPLPAPKTVEQRLVLVLPTYYAGVLLDPSLASDDTFLSFTRTKGLPIAHRRALRALTTPSSDALRCVVQHQIVAGRSGWSGEVERDSKGAGILFDEAASLAAKWRAMGGDTQNEATFYLALALSLHRPSKPDASSATFGDPIALDAVAAMPSAAAVGGLAAFDAAQIVEHFSPRAAVARYQDAAKRYRAAVDLLADPALKADAKSRAKAADDAAAFEKSGAASSKP